ncbi:hypothetical protein chiPu_0033329, partial [Chiloscyllium punctatum]|nr:hypothetical protein [Chiloscyllium punctatum]
MIRQRGRIIDPEIARSTGGLLPVHVDVGQDHRNAERLRLLDRRAPALEARRVEQRDTRSQQRVDVRQRDDAEVPEVGLETTFLDLGIDQVIVARLAPIFRAAGGADDHVDPTTLQDRQG